MSNKGGSGLTWVVAGGLAFMLLPLILFIGVAGSDAGQGPSKGVGRLDTSKVPPAYVPWIIKAGETCAEIGPAVIAAQIEAESNWNPAASSSVGAQGISQFMPGTWTTWGEDADGDGVASPFDPADAIMAQARYDCALAKQVNGYRQRGLATGATLDLTLAAYNAGPGNVEKYGGVPPFQETQGYVTKIKSFIVKYEAIAEVGTSVPAGQRMIAPLAGNAPVTSPYGMRYHPVLKRDKLHTGVDFGADPGTPVRASLAGTVTFAGWNDAYGNRVIISHGTLDGQTVSTTYNHMSALSVREGQKVGTGTTVGAVGNTGWSTGAHLHFEVQVNGAYVNPATWIGL